MSTSTSPTTQQQRAIEARGNVLVVAGAGAGKTQTVVDRCLAWLLDPENTASIDEVLMITFTNAAAAEMRQRIRQNLEKAPPSPRVAESLALLDTAHICTLHSFCFYLVGRHLSELGLDPKARVLPAERARLLERESLDLVLEKVYSSESASAQAIQQLIQAQGGDWDLPVRELILRLHHYTQTLRDPAAWFVKQKEIFENPEPVEWLRWLVRRRNGMARRVAADFAGPAGGKQKCRAVRRRIGRSARPTRSNATRGRAGIDSPRG